MKNMEAICKVALGMKDAAEQIQTIAARIENMEDFGDRVVAEASLDLLVAELEFVQKSVLSLTGYVVEAIGENRGDDSVFAPGELDSVLGDKTQDSDIAPEDAEVEE